VPRDIQTSADPQGTWDREKSQLEAVAAQTRSRCEALGLHYCAQWPRPRRVAGR